MTETEDIFRQFLTALHLEKRASGGPNPAVCVVGEHDYQALHGAALTMCVVRKDIHPCAGQSFECMGVKVFKSYFFKHGFYMGNVEE